MDDRNANLLNNRRLGRRKLLALGVASGVGAILTGVAGAEGEGSRSGIGYVLGSETWAARENHLGSQRLVVAPAGAVSPDPALANALLDITVHGLFPGLPGTDVSRVALDALFASFTKGARGPFPFAAWTFANGNPPRASGKVAFKMPVDPHGAVSFALRASDGAGDRTVPAVLSLRGRGASLRPGVYLLGLRGTEFTRETVVDPAGEPDWSHLSIVLKVQRGA